MHATFATCRCFHVHTLLTEKDQTSEAGPRSAAGEFPLKRAASCSVAACSGRLLAVLPGNDANVLCGPVPTSRFLGPIVEPKDPGRTGCHELNPLFCCSCITARRWCPACPCSIPSGIARLTAALACKLCSPGALAHPPFPAAIKTSRLQQSPMKMHKMSSF